MCKNDIKYIYSYFKELKTYGLIETCIKPNHIKFYITILKIQYEKLIKWE